MGQPIDNHYEREPLMRKSVVSRARKVHRAVLFLAAVILAVTFTMVMFKSSSTDADKGNQHSQPHRPPHTDFDTMQPYCPSAAHVLSTTSVPVNFKEGRSFHISQGTDDGQYYGPEAIHINTVGAILIRRLPNDSSYKDGCITTDIRASNPDIEFRMSTGDKASFLRIESPTSIPRSLNTGGRPCVSIEVTLWVPDDASIATLRLNSVTLDIKKHPEVVAQVIDNTNIKTVSGDVHFPDPKSKFESRRQEIKTISGTVTGTFNLLDYLHIFSISGSIKIDVLPKDEDPTEPAPAELHLHSVSGTIEGYFPFDQDQEATSSSSKETISSSSSSSSSSSFAKIPMREYRTEVDTKSGSIKGNFILGTHATFETISGDISLAMLYGHTRTISSSSSSSSSRDSPSRSQTIFSTECISGLTRVEIVNPDGIEPIRNLNSRHQSQSGHVSLQYPREWEGTIGAKSLSGRLRVGGAGVVVDGDRKGVVGRELSAHKGVGEGGSRLVVGEMSGDVVVVFGRE